MRSTRPVVCQRGARADDDLVLRGIEADDVKRFGRRNFDAAPLADRVVDDAVVAAEQAAVEMHDVAGVERVGFRRSMTSV